MSKKAWVKNGKLIVKNHKLIVCDKCPCGCPSFDGRSIIYVDKHATGTGDGSSWANAYTNIQTAINAHPKKEIQIQGYGEFDTYPGNIVLSNCNYLHGINDMWVDCENDTFGIRFGGDVIMSKQLTQLVNIRIKNVRIGFTGINGNIIDCEVKYTPPGTWANYGFSGCHGTIKDCMVHDIGHLTDENGARGFHECYADFTNCHVYNLISSNSWIWAARGFTGGKTYNNCSAKDIGLYGPEGEIGGGYGMSGYSFIDCTVDNARIGFSVASDATNCHVANNYDVGFFVGNETTIVACTVTAFESNNGHPGFTMGENCTLIDCDSRNNAGCGYVEGGLIQTSILTNCTESNNCLWWGGDCTDRGCIDV